ncbi:MAG: ATP-binding protein [Chloroflexota bacterium]
MHQQTDERTPETPQTDVLAHDEPVYNLRVDHGPQSANFDGYVVTNEYTSQSNWHMLHLYAEITRIDMYITYAVQKWQSAGENVENGLRGLVVTDNEAQQLLSLPFSGRKGITNEAEKTALDVLRQTVEHAAQQSYALLISAHQEGVVARLNRFVQTFGLSSFELDAFLVCLAPALDSRYEYLFGYLQNDITRRLPTVNLILEILYPFGVERLQYLPYFNEDTTLIQNQIIHLKKGANASPYRLGQLAYVDETIVAWLMGNYQPLSGLETAIQLEFVQPPDVGQPDTGQPDTGGKDWKERAQPTGTVLDTNLLTESARKVLERAVDVSLSGIEAQDEKSNETQPLILFYGADKVSQRLATAFLAQQMNQPYLAVDMATIVAALGKNESPLWALRRALRDARLTDAIAFLYNWDPCLKDGLLPIELLNELYKHNDMLVIASEEQWQPSGLERTRTVIQLTFSLPDHHQRFAFWHHYLADVFEHDPTMEETLSPSTLAAQFVLTAAQIRDAAITAQDYAIQQNRPLELEDLYAAARAHSGHRLNEMARKIEPRYDWEDIILPPMQIEILKELVNTVRNRAKVLEDWGVGKKLAASAAVTVLFAGPPGTGKTMSAEVIAKSLGLDLYKLDLSNLVSKYIGETEKNLEKIFTEAQSSNAILFFDEADAIFGKRSGVKDARDRYANIEVSYLLQRMESYDGVTILATNLRANLDEAFLRRIHFAVDIPFPDIDDRIRIWETLMPADIPRDPDLNLLEMARRFKLAGGNIRNIIVGAAFLAATDDGAITMRHLLHATRRELQKMGRLVSEAEMRIQ